MHRQQNAQQTSARTTREKTTHARAGTGRLCPRSWWRACLRSLQRSWPPSTGRWRTKSCVSAPLCYTPRATLAHPLHIILHHHHHHHCARRNKDTTCPASPPLRSVCGETGAGHGRQAVAPGEAQCSCGCRGSCWLTWSQGGPLRASKWLSDEALTNQVAAHTPPPPKNTRFTPGWRQCVSAQLDRCASVAHHSRILWCVRVSLAHVQLMRQPRTPSAWSSSLSARSTARHARAALSPSHPGRPLSPPAVVFLIFTVPKVYELKKDQIDQLIKLAGEKGKEGYAKFDATVLKSECLLAPSPLECSPRACCSCLTESRNAAASGSHGTPPCPLCTRRAAHGAQEGAVDRCARGNWGALVWGRAVGGAVREQRDCCK